jgi:transposase
MPASDIGAPEAAARHPKPSTEEDIYICPAGEKLTNHFTNEENGVVLHHYWTNACRTCALKAQCTKGPQRRIKRWEHEHVVDAVQARLDKNPDARRSSIRLAR